MSLKSLGSVLATGSVALLLAATTATSASAAPADHTEYAKVAGASPPSSAYCQTLYYPNPNVAAGSACFEKSGDVFWLRDRKADGHHVEMRAQMPSNGKKFRCHEGRGSGVGWQKCTSFASKIPEHDKIFWWLSVYEGSDALNTSNVQEAATT
ncbi:MULTISPECIES: hypothetical protein [unclassified Streptomyces]|uniref:hypothetical protein n=1 Tax=unclassified Streptomyces TaxID=2593676 RepID=UPI0037BBC2A3